MPMTTEDLPRYPPALQLKSPPTRLARLVVAGGMLAFWMIYYGYCLYPGLGGVMNAGDSAKFQTLGHSQILVHGPGYPLVLLLGAMLRALDLPVESWRAMAFALAAVPGAVANTMAFLIVERATRNIAFGVAAAFLLGSAGLMAVQSTEAEVYPLALAFILATAFMLMLFVETRQRGYFLAACAVYAISFGNHLMMIMLAPLFLWVIGAHWRLLLRPRMIALVLLIFLMGASQYLYLAYIAFDPSTKYSEYLPLPPTPVELVRYIAGTYFSGLYGSGFSSTHTSETLIITLRSAYPRISMPLIVVGLVLFAAGWRRRDAGWYALAIVLGTALSFLPFVLWYGAYDIQAFHLPVLGPLLIGAVAACGWWLGRWRAVQHAAAILLVVLGVWRAAIVAERLMEREPVFTNLPEAIEALVAQAPVDEPLVSMTYNLRMAVLYHELLGELPNARYRVPWRAEAAAVERQPVGGIVVPTDGDQLLRWIEYRHPDLACRSRPLEQGKDTPWPAYWFRCDPIAEPDAEAENSLP